MSPTISLMPHSVCWAAAPRLVWTMVVTNFITFCSYVSLCATLLYLVARTRRVIARDWYLFVVGFALFIVACGSTHLLEVITTWLPIFWVDAWTNIVTAALSAAVAIMLIRRASIIVFSINDYSARLANTESEKQQMAESLLAAQKLEDWSRMSAVISHEISSPLEAIHNILYLIRNAEGASPDVIDLAATAAAEATRVMTISRSTLSFFRQSAAPEAVDLRSAAESVCFLLDPVLKKRSITVDLSSSGEVVVEAFPGETRQVLLNLIRNAAEASTQPGQHITVTLTGQPSGVELVVADQGTGIDPALLPALFQFGRTTKGEQGNGMGLWTVKHILDKHSAEIKVDSTPGAGTRFTIWWPRHFATRSDPATLSQTA